MQETKHAARAVLDEQRLLSDLRSPDEDVRAKALHAVCPCHAGWELFEKHLEVVARLAKDPSPLVRRVALHVFEDAAQLKSSGLPTNPRETTNEMLRTRRRSRFRREDDNPSLGAEAGSRTRKSPRA